MVQAMVHRQEHWLASQCLQCTASTRKTVLTTTMADRPSKPPSSRHKRHAPSFAPARTLQGRSRKSHDLFISTERHPHSLLDPVRVDHTLQATTTPPVKIAKPHFGVRSEGRAGQRVGGWETIQHGCMCELLSLNLTLWSGG